MKGIGIDRPLQCSLSFSYFSPAPQADPQAAGAFSSSGLLSPPPAPQAEPQAVLGAHHHSTDGMGTEQHEVNHAQTGSVRRDGIKHYIICGKIRFWIKANQGN